jgi:DNA-directed RNA polymerase sigma subunit (sigma70/sigma32)
MNILRLSLILKLIGIIYCYKKYLTTYSWTQLRKKLSDKNISFEEKNKINFAKHLDFYINKNLIIGLTNLSPYKNENQFNYNKWYDTYWNCINNDLSPFNKELIQLKYNYNFDEIRKIDVLAKKFNTSSENITDIISSSLQYVQKQIKSQNDFGYICFSNKLNL